MNKTDASIALRDEIVMPMICLIRGQKGMLDRDLAQLYGLETKKLKEARRRNFGDGMGIHRMELQLERTSLR